MEESEYYVTLATRDIVDTKLDNATLAGADIISRAIMAVNIAHQ
jgi:hypothetical protein